MNGFRRAKKVLLLSVCTTSLWTQAAVAQDINVPPGAPGGFNFGQGSPTTRASAGQTFTVPPGATTLQSFSFFLQNWTNFQALQYRAFIARFDAVFNNDVGSGSIVGPILWQSTARFGTNSGSGEWTQFVTPALELIGGQSYFAFLSGAGLYEASGAQVGQIRGAGGRNEYPGGTGFWNTGSSPDVSGLESARWTGVRSIDFAFRADFEASVNVVPEPSSAVLLLTGVLAIGLAFGARGKAKQG